MKAYEQGLPDKIWDARQRSRGAHMLQGLPWARFQEALGRTLVWAEGDGWSWLGIVTRGRGTSYLYAPYGPTVRSAATLDAALASMRAAAVELKLDFVRVEPVGVPKVAVEKLGLIAVKDNQPQHSRIVDLRLDENELRSALSSSHRNTINGSERRGLTMRKSSDVAEIQAFLTLTHATASDRGIRPHADSYYETMLKTLLPTGDATLFLAEHDGAVASCSIVLDYEGTRGYAHTGNDPQLRKLRATAPLVWFMMLDAKAAGLERFDLWGTAPAGAPKDHPWQGFTEFKQSFGGDEISYTGTWELPLRPTKYKLIKLAKKVIR